MDGHLIAVKVRVIRDAYQRMELNRLALDQHRLKGLNSQAMQGGRAVQEHRMFADNLIEDIPDILALLLDHFLALLMVVT